MKSVGDIADVGSDGLALRFGPSLSCGLACGGWSRMVRFTTGPRDPVAKCACEVGGDSSNSQLGLCILSFAGRPYVLCVLCVSWFVFLTKIIWPREEPRDRPGL